MIAKKHLPKILTGFGVLVMVTGVGLYLRQRHQDAQTFKAAVANNTAPSTTKPTHDAFDNYKAAPDAPRYIFIPKIDLKAIVRPLGLIKDGQIDAPSNVYDAGWYNKSAKPGKPGAMLVDGHISSWTTHGIFYNLKDLKAGDGITIQRGDGVKISYEVVKSQIYDHNNVDMTAALQSIEPSKPGLNLISCSGSVIKGTNEFDKRLVVFAKQI